MKKALKINLSGLIFHIDEDAYEKLKIYLDTISSHFSNSSEGKEILSDIESRIAELFREKMSDDNQVISIKEVDEVIDIMGRPEEIADEDEMSNAQKQREHRASRRLFRDPDNAVFGGVSAGLSAYFNLDVLLIRIIFVIFTLFGAGALVYIILWIAVPKAETAAEKLEMRGEKVTVSNIEKAVKEEYEEVKENLKKARNSEGFRRTEDAFTTFFRVIGRIIIVFFKIILGIIALAFVITGISLLIGTFSFLFFGANFTSFGDGSIHHSLPEIIRPFANPENAYALVIALMFLILIPVLTIIYGLFKVIFRFKAKDKVLGMTASGIWFLALIATFMLVYYEGRNYRESEVVTETKALSGFQSDTLYLALDQSKLKQTESEDFVSIDHQWFFSNELDSFFGGVDVNIRKSSNSEYKIRIEKSARGRDNEGAMEFVREITYGFTQTDSSLLLNPYYEVVEKSPWRAQSVEVTVYVPVGKAVKINKNLDTFLGFHNSEDFSSWDVLGKTMVMKEDGLKLP